MNTKVSYKKLSPGVKAKWIKALRSGKYSQSSGQLCDLYGYCCLGVLAKIKNKLDKNYGIDMELEFGPSKLKKHEKLSNCSSFVPSTWIDPKAQGKLASMNDKGLSFKYIANWIEKYL
jgi:hypothetical protein